MGSSTWPRLYFAGHMYWNPSTYNNNDYGSADAADPPYANPLPTYDAERARLNWPWLGQQGVNVANFRHWSTELFDLGDAGRHKPPRKLAPPEWNFFGGNQCGFVTAARPVIEQPEHFSRPDGTTTVHAYTDAGGEYSTEGDWVGLEVQFNTDAHLGPFSTEAKLIDTNPKAPFTSQIFADDFRFGTPSAGFSAPVSHRLYLRWIYFQRNLNTDKKLMIAGIASTVFQTAFPYDAISWNGGSALQGELRTAAERDGGVLLQFAAYDTMYFSGDYFGPQDADQFPGMVKIRQLYVDYVKAWDAYRRGETTERPAPPCNRAYSRVAGWIGAWRHGEPITVPGGRVLLPAVVPNQPQFPGPDGKPQLPEPQPVVPAQGGPAVPFGNATVEAVPDSTGENIERVTVNLISTIPEWDSTGVRAEFGTVDLAILLPDPAEPSKLVRTKLATVVDDSNGADYQAEYDRTSGLVDIPASAFATQVSVADFGTHPLVLVANPAGGSPAVVLTENPLTAVANQRGQYVDEPGDEHGPTVTFTVQVDAFGAKPKEQVGLVVAEYTEALTLVQDDPIADLFYRTPLGEDIPIDGGTVVDAGSGEVTIGLRGAAPGLPYLCFYPVAHELVVDRGLTPAHPIPLPHGVEVPMGDNGAMPSAFYATVRVLPFHHADARDFEQWLAHEAPDVADVTEAVFQQVFETFHLMYPVMDFIDTPVRFQAWRGRILEVTDPENFSKSGYMPPMRSLSAGQRRILELYNDYLDGVNKPDSQLRKADPPAAQLRRG